MKTQKQSMLNARSDIYNQLTAQEKKDCIIKRNNIDEINKSAKIIYTKIVVISQAHRRTKIELDNNYIPSLLSKTIIIIINGLSRKRLINHSDDNYEKNGFLRDKTNGNIYKIKFIYGKNSKNIKGKFKAN